MLLFYDKIALNLEFGYTVKVAFLLALSIIYTFKFTSKPSSICMTPRDDNGEQAFCQIIIPFTFDEFSKVLSLYEYVYVGVDDEIIQYHNVLRTDSLCVYRRGEGGVEG